MKKLPLLYLFLFWFCQTFSSEKVRLRFPGKRGTRTALETTHEPHVPDVSNFSDWTLLSRKYTRMEGAVLFRAEENGSVTSAETSEARPYWNLLCFKTPTDLGSGVCLGQTVLGGPRLGQPNLW
ncbi:hypothetical protein SLA2020_268320 [Shorea laevis]